MYVCVCVCVQQEQWDVELQREELRQQADRLKVKQYLITNFSLKTQRFKFTKAANHSKEAKNVSGVQQKKTETR